MEVGNGRERPRREVVSHSATSAKSRVQGLTLCERRHSSCLKPRALSAATLVLHAPRPDVMKLRILGIRPEGAKTNQPGASPRGVGQTN
jgi:hypothetical protein